MQRFRLVLAVTSALLLIFSLIQGLLFGFGLTLPFIAVSLAGVWLCLRWDVSTRIWTNLRKRFWGKVATSAVTSLIAVAIIVCAVVSGFMVSAMRLEPTASDTTVIVLGARVTGERPSLILQLRLEVAAAYLDQNPAAAAVLSGGLGENAYVSEAEAMKRWLVANGICESRLFLEEHSTNTFENITFSQAIISENGLPQNVVIATDGFHMFRAHGHARQAGLEPSSIPSRTPLRLLPFYWAREIAAILAAGVV